VNDLSNVVITYTNISDINNKKKGVIPLFQGHTKTNI